MLPAATHKCISFKQRFDAFLAWPGYIVILALLTEAANIFALELPVYSIFAALIVYCCFWGKDLLPVMPIFLYSYLAPSVQNNPGRNPDSVFFQAGGGLWIAVLAAAIGISLIYRVIRDRDKFFRHKYELLPSILLLAGAYLLSGLGSRGYGEIAGRNLLFSLLQGLSILVPYCLFSAGIDWKSARKNYFAWIGFCAGGLLVCEILYIYRADNVIIDGVIHRENIFTGWGIHNNLGSMLAMMIPFAFYLATKYRKGWIGTVVGSGFLLGVVLSCSRNAILVGTAIYIVCVVLMLLYARNRKANFLAASIFSTVVLVLLSLFYQPVLRLFSDLLSLGFDPNSRDSIFLDGMRLFARYPIFGGSFFSQEFTPWGWSTVAEFSNFFPPRWHNTIVQLLASCGVVGMAAYVYHRVRTVKLFFDTLSKETVFIGASVFVLLICSLFDCHFFNIGPTLFYAMALAFAENCNRKQKTTGVV